MRYTLAFAAVLLLQHPAVAATCPFAAWTRYLDSPVLQHPSGAYVFATTGVKVDADGAPNAYHPDDVGLHCTKDTGFRGLDCPANAGYPGTPWWPSVLVADPQDPSRPYIQPPSSAFAGFFVSQTSLKDTAKPSTDPSKYVDSRSVPYLVFPGNFHKMKGTGNLGDVGFALNISNGKGSALIVAEIGPAAAKLGELSIALAAALGGENLNPRTGAGAPTGKILYVIFPRSAATPAWPLTPEALSRRAEAFLSNVGGIEALASCREAL